MFAMIPIHKMWHGLVQEWAITFLSEPVTNNELSYWDGGSKLNIEA